MEFSTCQPGTVLGSLQTEALTRHTLALYCGASGDHNPLHVDIDAARRSGLDDVIAHGMLVMAFLGRLLTGLTAMQNLRSFSVRFVEAVRVGDSLTCEATLVALHPVERRADVDLAVRCQRGELKVSGRAVVSFGDSE
jgi:acyl dehydratase